LQLAIVVFDANFCFRLGAGAFKLQFWIVVFDESYVFVWVPGHLNCNFGSWFLMETMFSLGCRGI
jgi:hypothetical protein